MRALLSSAVLTAGVSLVCLVGVEARGEMLLVEVRWEHANPVTLPASFGFNAGGYSMNGFGSPEIQQGYVTSYPVEQSADPATLHHWNTRRPIDDFDAYVSEWRNGDFGYNSQQSSWQIPSDKTHWSDGRMINSPPLISVGTWTVTPHAPQLGRGLEGYWLSRAERIIDADGQTVSFYGFPVPEPATGIMVAIGMLVTCAARV